MYFIILTTAATLFTTGKTDVASAPMPPRLFVLWPATAQPYSWRSG
jgi:hypothetical protein